MASKHRFEWGYVTHPGVWACGGGRQDIPPVLVGITFQVPQKDPEYAWWCYLGPRPEFENEFDPDDKDKRYFDQCQAVPQRVTKNMSDTRQMNELRKWLAHEMQDEAQASGEVNRSDHARMRGMAKAVAYNRVMQKMDEIESASAKSEIESRPSIRDMWVSENGIQ